MRRKIKYAYYEDFLDFPPDLGEGYKVGDIIELEDGVFEVLEVSNFQELNERNILLDVPSKLKKIIMKQEMKTYIGTKTIRACKMNRKEYNTLRGWEVPKDENPEDEGYLVEYINNSKPNVEGFEGYISWSPTEPFEEVYRIAETWKDRVLIEIEELENKFNKLNNFIHSITDPTEMGEGYNLLLEQQSAMNTYIRVLKDRIYLKVNIQ